MLVLVQVRVRLCRRVPVLVLVMLGVVDPVRILVLLVVVLGMLVVTTSSCGRSCGLLFFRVSSDAR